MQTDLVLAQKPVSRVHHRHIALLAHVDQVILVDVRRHEDALGRAKDMRRRRVGVGVDREGWDAEVDGGADDPESNLAAVRDEQLVPRACHRGQPERWKQAVAIQLRASGLTASLEPVSVMMEEGKGSSRCAASVGVRSSSKGQRAKFLRVPSGASTLPTRR